MIRNQKNDKDFLKISFGIIWRDPNTHNINKLTTCLTWRWFTVKRERVSDRPSWIRLSQPAGSGTLYLTRESRAQRGEGCVP